MADTAKIGTIEKMANTIAELTATNAKLTAKTGMVNSAYKK